MSPILAIVLVGALVFMVVSTIMRNKKENERRIQMMNELKPGTNVITVNGIYGKIESIEETTDGKIVLLSTGKGDKVSYMEIHFNAISAIDNKQLVVLDENGNDITPMPESKTEEKVEEVKEEPKTETKKSKKSVKTETSKAINEEEKDSVINELEKEKKSTKKSKKN